MVSDYDDAGQVECARSTGIEVLRGHGRLAGPGSVEVDDQLYTADHVVIATGADPVIPPAPGLRQLSGVWTNRDVPGLTEIPGRVRLSAGPGLWAIGDVAGLWQLTHVGEYQGRVVADNILGRPRVADYQAVPRIVYCSAQAASVGAPEGPFASTVQLSGVASTATYTRAYDTQPGFLTLVSDGQVITGAHAVGPEAGEWLQQATLAIRARVPLPVLLDVIQPFPTFSEAFLQALRGLDEQVSPARRATTSVA